MNADWLVSPPGGLTSFRMQSVNPPELPTPNDPASWDSVKAQFDSLIDGRNFDSCVFTFTAGQESDGSFGGEAIGPDYSPRVTDLQLASKRYAESLQIVTGFDGGHAELDSTNSEGATHYTVSPSGTEQQLTESGVDSALAEARQLIGSCFPQQQ